MKNQYGHRVALVFCSMILTGMCEADARPAKFVHKLECPFVGGRAELYQHTDDGKVEFIFDDDPDGAGPDGVWTNIQNRVGAARQEPHVFAVCLPQRLTAESVKDWKARARTIAVPNDAKKCVEKSRDSEISRFYCD